MNFNFKKTAAVLLCAVFIRCACVAEDLSKYDGCVIRSVEASSNRIKPEILKNRFPLREGQIFNSERYEDAQNELHDLRIAKKLSFDLKPSEGGAVDISVKAEDGYYIFPLIFATGGKKSAAGASLAAGNLFKRGETLMLFGGTGKNGSMASLMLKDGENIYQASFINMNFEQRFYKGSRINNDGIFSTTDDEEDFKNPINKIYTKTDSFHFLYARQKGYFTGFISPEYKYVRYSKDMKSGNYSTVGFGLNYRKNIRSGANMGALFGYGLTDKEQSLKNLPAPIIGYSLQAAYKNGGDWTGADFNISKISAEARSVVEFKNRHILNVYIKGEDSFSAPFAEQVRADDLMSGQGRYSRTLYGERGAGTGISFAYYLARNNTGLLALQPFYELAYVYSDKYRALSGAGATLSYKFWRFPFPLGINYTQNLSDGSNQISFVFGGKF